jgi:putative GTP pyrophosphokinase
MRDVKRSGADCSALLDCYRQNKHDLKIFMEGVARWFSEHPALSLGMAPVVHSVKSRLKDESHLQRKINRKSSNARVITPSNLLAEITDLAGVRVLHLYPQQIEQIHRAICQRVNDREWVFVGKPVAYTWDPESSEFLSEIGLRVELKPSYYTSVHYVVKPRRDASVACEIQVRTLFEEIWGEIDHSLNYPDPTSDLSCKEQLRVLSKLIGAGSRLADAIFRTSNSSGSVSVDLAPRSAKRKRRRALQ